MQLISDWIKLNRLDDFPKMTQQVKWHVGSIPETPFPIQTSYYYTLIILCLSHLSQGI